MNKIKTLFVCLAAMVAGNAAAQKLVVDDVILAPGKTANMVVKLESDKVAKNTQFSVQLPDGITPVYDEEEEAYLYEEGDILMKSPSIVCELDGSGALTVLIYKNGKQTYKETSGVIITIPLQASADIAETTYEGQLYNIEVGDANGAFADTEVVSHFNIVVDEGIFVGIRNINVDAANQKIYTVGGQLVTSKNLKKGIYVVDGKKVTVK